MAWIIPAKIGQYYDWWCPGNTETQGISSNDLNCKVNLSLSSARKDYNDLCHFSMMTSSNGNIFRVTGPLCGELTGHQWIPLTKASDTVDIKIKYKYTIYLKQI